MNISIWGFTESFITRQWVSYTVDFKDILERNCEYLLQRFPVAICKLLFPKNPFRGTSFNQDSQMHTEGDGRCSVWAVQQWNSRAVLGLALCKEYKGCLCNLSYSVVCLIK